MTHPEGNSPFPWARMDGWDIYSYVVYIIVHIRSIFWGGWVGRVNGKPGKKGGGGGGGVMLIRWFGYHGGSDLIDAVG